MKLLYIHSVDVESKKANLIQVLSMCNSFVNSNMNVTLLLPETENLIEDSISFISLRFGIKPNFKIFF